ncbi:MULTISPECIES: PepSY-associated TM helix domain-containing protein [Sphingobacterium]|uniref:PepSY-associated TM helix domain-containing protein n=1 Tax=Sphingobacterium TaxID=28453 RepID=UPI0013DAF499|nr:MULTISPECIES: PepSY-associated TM helix domain-containing protein [unclassified Sphingobacterium]
MFKSWILWLHKWLGLLSGIVVVIVSLTGCIYVFHDDLKSVVYPAKYYITDSSKNKQVEPLPLSTLLAKSEKALGAGKKVSRVDLYPAADRTWVFRAMDLDESKHVFWDYYTYYDRVFINPYTGQVQQIEDSKTEFFQLVLQTHMNLLLGKAIGKPLVAWSTILFIVLIISGIPLWWPKKWRGKPLRRSLWLRFKAKKKRLNYDLHNVLGFHTALLALILCITGLVFAYPGFKAAYVSFFNGISVSDSDRETELAEFQPVPQVYAANIDNALLYSLKQHPTADMMSIRLRGAKAEMDDIQIRLSKDKTSDFVWYYFARSDGQIDKVLTSERMKAGDKLASMNFDLHVGSIGGMGTKILAFVVSLICASLPITGFIIWMNKKTK